MKPINHHTARALLQSAADQNLDLSSQALLDAHLAECDTCRDYAQSLSDLQDGLRRVTRQQWNIRNNPLPLRSIRERARKVAVRRRIEAAAGRLAVVPVLALAVMMAVRLAGPRQIPQSVDDLTLSTPSPASLTPMPSSHTTATKLIDPAVCQEFVYIVQENDTLEAIAARYGVPKETIAAYNGMGSYEVSAQTRLVIPVCQATPTGTVTVPVITITIDPSPRG